MTLLNQTLSYILYKIGYLIVTPKVYSFGGYYLSILGSEKISKFKKKKKIYVFPFFNLREKNVLNTYHKELSINFFKNQSIFEKFLCIPLTIYLNTILLLHYVFKKILKKKSNSILFNIMFPDYIGYSDRNYQFDLFSKKINKIFNNPNAVSLRTDLSKLYKSKKKKVLNLVSFSIKDNNYSKIKEISTVYSSNVEHCKKALNFLLKENFRISKIGDKTMNKLNYSSQNYIDYCYLNNNNNIFNREIANCSFYFGSSSSMGISGELFNKNKFIINEVDHSFLNLSQSKKNFFLFKKVYRNENKKIIKISEQFEKNIFEFKTITDMYYKNQIYLVENNENEIFQGIVEFYEFNYKNRKKNFLLNKKYDELRKFYLHKYFNKYFHTLKCYNCTIPEFFLKDNL